MAARLAREVRDLLVSPENGVRLVVDEATGLPSTLQELTVRAVPPFLSVAHGGLVGRRTVIFLFPELSAVG
jgi:hypothetical protein